MEYTINYHTGAGNETIESENLEAVKSQADEGAAYTQQDISIEDENGKEVARRAWNGVEFEEGDAEDPIKFGSSGFYGDWYEQ
jgi:hypothetical protein